MIMLPLEANLKSFLARILEANLDVRHDQLKFRMKSLGY